MARRPRKVAAARGRRSGAPLTAGMSARGRRRFENTRSGLSNREVAASNRELSRMSGERLTSRARQGRSSQG